MTKSEVIEEGDIVSVAFNNAQITLCKSAIVRHKPVSTGDSWVFVDTENNTVHYVSEGCTVTKLDEKSFQQPITQE